MTNKNELQQNHKSTTLLIQRYNNKSFEERANLLTQAEGVKNYLEKHPLLNQLLNDLDLTSQGALKSLLALGQGPYVFQKVETLKNPKTSLKEIVETLEQVEKFYKPIGGLFGYHATFLQLLVENEPCTSEKIRYLQPEGLDLSQKKREVNEAIFHGVKHLPLMAEIYPVGGAGDRLGLRDEITGEPLPAALLNFEGHSLLETLIRDLQGREHLFTKLFNIPIITPIALMTSEEKDNDRQMKRLCEENNWFGRPKESFFFFTQPLVPVISKEGHWLVQSPLKLILKPGGHGALWKQLLDHAIFEELEKQGKKKALIRQINNPVAGIDHALLAFTGLGCKEDRVFGFASCPRLINTPEGVDVVIETKVKTGYEYRLTNIEYTDFEKRAITDTPKEPNSNFSSFPSNTNILFADLAEMKKLAKVSPIPGVLINLKSKFSCLDPEGGCQEIVAGRLESTMQNIADFITDKTSLKLAPEELKTLKTFVVFNERRKTISVAKQAFIPGKEFLGTPLGAFYEMIQNRHELLRNYCHLKVPDVSREDFIENDPSFIFRYHPSLGPLFTIIGQKIRGGTLTWHSELDLEIAEIDLENVEVEGSLRIFSSDVQKGRCTLKNCHFKNKGIEKHPSNCFWKNQVKREEEFILFLHENSEFIAEGITFKGPFKLEVPAGHQMIAKQTSSEISFELKKIEEPSWSWDYFLDEEYHFSLRKTPGRKSGPR